MAVYRWWLLTLGVLVLQASVESGVPFPHYLQCDASWGNVTMGVPGMSGDDTICHQGCAMTSLSMALAGFGISVDGAAANPLSLNRWLQENEGYTCLDGDCCNLVLNSVEKLSPNIRCLGEPDVPFQGTLEKLVNAGLVLLAHVRDRSHFVLLTGVNGTNASVFNVLDPFFNVTEYHYSCIHDVIIYDVRNASSHQSTTLVNAATIQSA